MAQALIVEADYTRGFDAPSNVIRGAGEGAATGMGAYIGGMAQAGGEGALLGLLLAPIGLPISAAIGASQAHSDAEVSAAVDAFETVGQDMDLLASIDRRIVSALGHKAAAQWACVEAASATSREPCAGHTALARLELRPAFELRPTGSFDPDIHFFGSVVAVVSIDSAELDSETVAVLEAKWAYREELGAFFALARDDAALLRRRLDDILDRFASQIADDLYLAPRPETVTRKEEFGGHIFTEIPDGVAVRVEQGFDLASPATHGTVRPSRSTVGESCWIDAVEGKPTGHSHRTAAVNRGVQVRAGLARLDVSCIRHPGSINEESGRYNIEISLDTGVIYETDGRMYRRLER